MINSILSLDLYECYRSPRIHWPRSPLENISIPIMNSNSKICLFLSKLNRQANKLTANDDLKKLMDVENAIDQVATQLWGLTERELADIRSNLAELLWKPGGEHLICM